MNNRSLVLPLILGLALSTAALVAQQSSFESRLGAVVTASAPASEPVTYLGAMTVPAPQALTSQLGLPAGMGLLVVAVQPDSPAASALKVDDILVRLDDQTLIEVNQLAVLVRNHREGDEVTLTYLRSGQEAQAKARLAKRAALVSVTQVNVGGGGGGTSMKTSSNADGTKIVYTDVNGIIELNTVGGRKSVVVKGPDGAEIFSGPFDTDAERAAVPAAVRIRIESVEQRVTQQRVVMLPLRAPASASATEILNDPQAVIIRLNLSGGDGGGGSGTLSPARAGGRSGSNRTGFSDASGSIEISTIDGHKTVVVKNPDGTEIFSGPFDTEAERAAAPVAVRTRVEEFEKRTNLSTGPRRGTQP